MAFNPFHGFNKYKRVWMALLMIMTMITFVVCTGVQGDLSDRLLSLFRRRGTVIGSIDGTNLYREDLDKLKLQRTVANDYMRTFSNLLLETINERLKAPPEKDDENTKKAMMQFAQTRALIMARTKNKHFFDTGVKTEELVDFRTWLAEADRLGVSLLPQHLHILVAQDLYKTEILPPQQDELMQTRVYQKVRDNHGYNINIPFVAKALEDEYRVRIAQLAVSEYQLRTLDPRIPKRLKADASLPAVMARDPLSPGHLWEFFQENRQEFDVALLPIPVQRFIKDVGQPDAKALEELFNKHKTVVFDPASDTPGFRKPQMAKVQWASADPDAKFYKTIARTVNALSAFPVGALVPQMPMLTAISMAAGPTVTDGLLQEVYEQRLPFDAQGNAIANRRYEGAGNLDLDFATPMAVWLARKEPVAAAVFLAALARPDTLLAATPAYAAVGAFKHPAELKAGLALEIKRRFPRYASVVASGSLGAGLVSAAQLTFLGQERVLLPLPIVRQDLLEIVERGQAGRWVSANMQLLKKRMEDERVAGKKLQMERLLERFGPAKKQETVSGEGDYRDLGLELGHTKDFFDRYHADQPAELKPLREAYDKYFSTINFAEGRGDLAGKPPLAENEFWKLIFDASETFSIASGRFSARPWPPVVTPGNPAQLSMMLQDFRNRPDLPDVALGELMRLSQNRDPARPVSFSLFNYAEKPFLFWKTDEKPSEVPEKLADVRDKVEDAWKFLQARETKALPFAKTLADKLLSGNADYADILKLEGQSIGSTLVSLPRLANLYAGDHFGQTRVYGEYKLPKGLVTHPRDDMVSHILALHDLKEPIKTGIADIDNVNSTLFNQAKSQKLGADKFVQILTNKPRDTYYVAVVQANLGANRMEFFFRVLPGAAMRSDTLFDTAQEKLGSAHQRELMQQLRRDHRVVLNEAAKSLDSEVSQ